MNESKENKLRGPAGVGSNFFPKVKKEDDIPFDAENHKKLLKEGGFYDYRICEDYLYIQRRESRKVGFGTASTRHLVEISLNNPKLKGNVRTEADFSSHIFHLKMGMIPEGNVFYVSGKYGVQFEESIKALLKFPRGLGPYLLLCLEQICMEKFGLSKDNGDLLKFFDNRSLFQELKKQYLIEKTGSVGVMAIEAFFQSPLRSLHFDLLKVIYRTEKNLSKDHEIPLTTLFENHKFFEGLLTRELSKAALFIDDALGLLEQCGGKSSRSVSTFGMESIRMVLSDKGKERWRDAISRGVGFKPFRNFEQLIPYMTKEQLCKYEKILASQAPKPSSSLPSSPLTIEETVEDSPTIDLN
ncbi:MAG TPA: hypothetical protein VHE99_08440 [Gammaproteobacteria bacterium]|nr:hypothetical protein [Gammaproteobacteria bacterium]